MSFFLSIFSCSGTAALEEDAQILKVIEAYCTSAKTRQTLNSSKRTQSRTCTVHVHAQKKRGSYCSLLSLRTAVPVFCASQCLSLTLVL